MTCRRSASIRTRPDLRSRPSWRCALTAWGFTERRRHLFFCSARAQRPSMPVAAASEAQEPRQRVLLVTGLLGAGKTTALRVLEDLGWETVDNFPIRFLDRLIDSPLAVGVDDGAPLAI